MPDLKDTLLDKKIPENQVTKIIAYINNAKREEAKKEPGKRPVTNNSADQLYSMIMKYWGLGLAVDGVNVVITGNSMAMVTFNGYKNRVLAVYPETEFDIQLVREGDTFKVSKESGAVIYTHEIGDPFGDKEQPIIGAYVVFKNKRGEFIETLNKTDYEKMKKASKQSYLWGEWASEFWLKSVIKRACKRHFYDIIEEIDKNDNDNYGALAPGEPPIEPPDVADKADAVIAQINTARDREEADKMFQISGLMNNKKVVEAYKAKKLSFPPTKQPKSAQPEPTNADN